MRPFKLILCLLLACALVPATGARTPVRPAPIVIAVSRLFDGRGRGIRTTRIVVEAGTILRIDPKAGPVDYDLRGLTVMPGWIDAHVHITWSFGKDGKNAGAGETPQGPAYRSAENARLTLLAGFTTVQSVGSPTDLPLRDAIARTQITRARTLPAGQALLGAG